jgi:hypothetical protein
MQRKAEMLFSVALVFDSVVPAQRFLKFILSGDHNPWQLGLKMGRRSGVQSVT